MQLLEKQWKMLQKKTFNVDIKLVTNKTRRNYLTSESNKKFFSKNLLAIEMRETKILMNKPAYQGLSVL